MATIDLTNFHMPESECVSSQRIGSLSVPIFRTNKADGGRECLFSFWRTSLKGRLSVPC